MSFQEIFRSGRPMYVLRTRGLRNDAVYHMRSRSCMMNIKPVSGRFLTVESSQPYVRMPRETEDYTLPGDFLNNCGIRLKSDFNGHNLDEDTRYYTDYATRLYDFEMIESQD